MAELLGVERFSHPHVRVDAVVGATPSIQDAQEALADELLKQHAVLRAGGSTPESEMRQRAFTLMHRTYDEVRRMVSFLRWHENDVEKIAPSFFHGPGNKRRRKATETPPP